jgi:hypothetical protein
VTWDTIDFLTSLSPLHGFIGLCGLLLADFISDDALWIDFERWCCFDEKVWRDASKTAGWALLDLDETGFGCAQ